MAALMLPLPTKATTECMMRKQTLAQTDASPRTIVTEKPQVIHKHLDPCIEMHYKQRAQRRDEKILTVQGS